MLQLDIKPLYILPYRALLFPLPAFTKNLLNNKYTVKKSPFALFAAFFAGCCLLFPSFASAALALGCGRALFPFSASASGKGFRAEIPCAHLVDLPRQRGGQVLSGNAPLPVARRVAGGVHAGFAAFFQPVGHRHNSQLRRACQHTAQQAGDLALLLGQGKICLGLFALGGVVSFSSQPRRVLLSWVPG